MDKIQNRNKIPWNKGKTWEELVGKERAEEIKEKDRQAHLGKSPNTETRKKLGDATRGKTLEEIHGKKKADEMKEKDRQAHMGNKYGIGNKGGKGLIPWNKGLTKETDERVRKYAEKGGGQFKKGEHTWENFRKRPTKPELVLNIILQQQFPNEYKYVGDGNFILGGRCPDFTNINGQKKLVELFGTYWHKVIRPDNSEERISFFKEFGFETLIVWDDELKDLQKLKEKLESFHLS